MCEELARLFQGYTAPQPEQPVQATDTCHFIARSDIPKDKQLEVSLIENIHREELNALEIANAYQRLIDDHGYAQHELADKVGSLVTVIMGAIFVICVLAFRRGIVGESLALYRRIVGQKA